MEKDLTKFIDLAKIPKHRWWSYILGFVFIFTCWAGACELSEFILARVHSEIFNSVFWLVYWLTHNVGLEKLSLIASVLLVVRVFHRRPLRSIITANSYVSLKNFALGFGV